MSEKVSSWILRLSALLIVAYPIIENWVWPYSAMSNYPLASKLLIVLLVVGGYAAMGAGVILSALPFGRRAPYAIRAMLIVLMLATVIDFSLVYQHRHQMGGLSSVLLSTVMHAGLIAVSAVGFVHVGRPTEQPPLKVWTRVLLWLLAFVSAAVLYVIVFSRARGL